MHPAQRVEKIVQAFPGGHLACGIDEVFVRLSIGQIDVVELNEAFAAQGLATLRMLGLPDDAAHVNPNGGAIALGHPLGASGARLVLTAVNQLQATGGRYAVATMCIGVGQGIAMLVERV